MAKNKNFFLKMAILIIAFIGIAFPMLQSEAKATTHQIEYLGKVTYGLSTVGDFRINGKQAFCTDHKKTTPPSGTTVESSIYEDDNIVKCLYYGWGGEEQWNFESKEQGIVYTSLALDHYKNGNTNNTAKSFIQYIDSMPVPQTVLYFSENLLNAFLIDNNMQRTQSITVNGSSKYYLTINLQERISLVNETRGIEETGSVNVYGGEQFYLKAPLSISGSWTSNNIDNHKYKFQPIIYTPANANYQTLTSEYQVIPDITSSINLNVNWLSNGNLKIIKVDGKDKVTPISGVTFEIWNVESNEKIETETTNENGIIELNNLTIGEYRIIETNTNKWYNLGQEKRIIIEPNKTSEIIIENELKKGQIKIIKTDSENNKIKLQGVKFEILDENNNVLETLITDKNGEATTQEYALKDYSKLIIREKETLQNYVLNNTLQIIELEANQIKTVTLSNELKKGRIKVIKVSKEDNPYNEKPKGTGIANAKFKVYDKDNNLVCTLITDEKGEAITPNLLKGKYTLKEVESPDYYILNEEIFNIEIVEHNEIIEVKVEDDNVNINVEVTKKGISETENKDNIYYDFSNIHNKSNISLDNFTWSDSLPTNALRANKIYTGTWNEELNYSIWYKTNLLDDYILLIDGLSTLLNNEVSFIDIILQEGEFITDFEFRFGTVKAGFKEVEQPRLYCNLLDNLPNGFVFVNHTKVSGNYKNIYVEDKDDWKTIIYTKQPETPEKLPRTGMDSYNNYSKYILAVLFIYIWKIGWHAV